MEKQMLDAVLALTPAQRQIVLDAAEALRAARLAGDTRPPAEIVAHMLRPPDLRPC